MLREAPPVKAASRRFESCPRGPLFMHEGYKCNNCGKMHSTSQDAEGCCLPDLYMICDICNEEFFDSDLCQEHEEEHT